MHKPILQRSTNRPADPRAVRRHLGSSCSIAALSLAGGVALSGSAAACPAAVGSTITIADAACATLDLGPYGSGTNLLLSPTGSMTGAGPLIFNSVSGVDFGGIDIQGGVTATSGHAIVFDSATTSLGSISNTGTISRTNSANAFSGLLLTSTSVTGALTNSGTISNYIIGIDLNNTAIGGGIVNNGTISGRTYGISYTGGAPLTITNNAGKTISGGTNSLLLSGPATVNNAGTLTGAVDLGSAGALNITGTSASVSGATTGTGTSSVNIGGNFTTGGNFTVPFFVVASGTTNVVNAINGAVQIDSGAQLRLGGYYQTGGAINGAVTNNGLLFFNASAAYTYGGVISGSGGLVAAGGVAGTSLILTGANTFTGGVTISNQGPGGGGGRLQIGDGGTTGSIASDVSFAGTNGALLFNRSDTYTFDYLISGGGTVAQAGPGTVILTKNNSYSGATTVSAGTLILAGSSASNGATIASGATLQIGNGGTTGSFSANIANSGALVFNRSNALTYGNIVSGTGSLTQNGAGTLTLSGVNTYTGATTVLAGTLKAGGSTTAFGSNSATTVNAGATLDLGGFSNTIGSLAGGGTVTNSGAAATLTAGADNASTTFSGVIQNGPGALSLTKSGAGTLTLTGNNTYTGVTTISGVLQIGAGGTTGSVAGNIFNSGGVIFNRSDDFAYGGDITSSGWITKLGANTLTLSGANSHSGATNLSAGVLKAGSTTAFSQSSDITVSAGATLDLAGFSNDVGSLAGAGTVTNSGAATTLAIRSNTNTTFSGVIQDGAGALSLNKSFASGTLTLTGGNTYTGGTTISAGTLQLGDGGTTGSVVGNILNNSTLAINRSDTYGLWNVISGTGSFTKSGTNTIGLLADNTYTGVTTISGGTLQMRPSVLPRRRLHLRRRHPRKRPASEVRRGRADADRRQYFHRRHDDLGGDAADWRWRNVRQPRGQHRRQQRVDLQPLQRAALQRPDLGRRVAHQERRRNADAHRRQHLYRRHDDFGRRAADRQWRRHRDRRGRYRQQWRARLQSFR